MIPRITVPLCVICQEYTKYRAAELGYGEVQGVKVKISRNDPVCLHHKMTDQWGGQMMIVEAETAVA